MAAGHPHAYTNKHVRGNLDDHLAHHTGNLENHLALWQHEIATVSALHLCVGFDLALTSKSFQRLAQPHMRHFDRARMYDMWVRDLVALLERQERDCVEARRSRSHPLTF